MSLLEKQRIVEAYERSILEKQGFDVDTDKKFKDCMDKNSPKMGFDAANRLCGEQVKVSEKKFDIDTDQDYKACMDKNSAKMGSDKAHAYCMDQLDVSEEGDEEDYEEDGKKKKKKKKKKDDEEDEDISEILRLKPEHAKKKAQEKLKQIAGEITKAIEKHGEESKVVLYLRAKKKKLAGAMAESLDEQKEQHQRQQLTMIANQIATIVMDEKGRNSALRGLKTHLPTFAVWEKGNKTSLQRDIEAALQKALKTQYKDPNIWGPQSKE